jgi:hypothetical protein
MIRKNLEALTYSSVHPKPKVARTITKPKALPQGMNAPTQDTYQGAIPGMSNQNDLSQNVMTGGIGSAGTLGSRSS